jgi:hypothetical protein
LKTKYGFFFQRATSQFEGRDDKLDGSTAVLKNDREWSGVTDIAIAKMETAILWDYCRRRRQGGRSGTLG